jgi:hypothetical protein
LPRFARNEPSVIANVVWQSMNPLFSTMDRRASLAMTENPLDRRASLAMTENPLDCRASLAMTNIFVIMLAKLPDAWHPVSDALGYCRIGGVKGFKGQKIGVSNFELAKLAEGKHLAAHHGKLLL